MFPKPKRIKDPKLLKSFRERKCEVCFRFGDVVGHHITTKGAGGDDTEFNLMALCTFHHRMVHDKGNRFMIETFKQYEWALEKRQRFDIIEKAMSFSSETSSEES